MTALIKPEIWKQIKQFPSYAVSTHGCVKRIEKGGNRTYIGKILKPGLNSTRKYFCVDLHESRRGHTKRIHRLVIETFKNKRPEGYECNHLDGNTFNNNINNLEWVTHKDHVIHSANVLGCSRGERNGRHKLTELQVNQIREMYKTNNYTHRALAKMFNVSHLSISNIIRRKKWKHI